MYSLLNNTSILFFYYDKLYIFREIVQYSAAADSTIPSNKRKVEEIEVKQEYKEKEVKQESEGKF